MIIEYISDNPQKTVKAGTLFAKALGRFDTVLLSGELGAGKTTFITGVAAALGVKVNISSPSFAIFNVYNAKKRRKFVHADLYRLDGINEIVNTGIEDYLYDKNTLVFIEWGTKLGGYLKNSFIEIDFSYLEDAKRKIVFKSASRYWDKKLEKLEVILKKCR